MYGILSSQDIDECRDVTLNKCNQKENCQNREFGYDCDCDDGYSIDKLDPRTCKSK